MSYTSSAKKNFNIDEILTLDLEKEQGFRTSFYSDNASGVHPWVFDALQAVNHGHTYPYAQDPYSLQLQEVFRSKINNPLAQVYMAFNGTGANVLSLRAMARSFESVICTDCAHILIDECGAPVWAGGFSLLPQQNIGGKFNLETLERDIVSRIGFIHTSQPKVISITQPTEKGTVYSLDELARLRTLANKYNLTIHMDGARIANAIEYMKCSFEEITQHVDILSFGGTKNGLMRAEAIVVLNPDLQENFQYLHKQSLQLTSKSRFMAAELLAYFDEDLWLSNAGQSNALAQLLSEQLNELNWITLLNPVEANLFYLTMPFHLAEQLSKVTPFYFYRYKENQDLACCRFVTSFDQNYDDVNYFVEACKRINY